LQLSHIGFALFAAGLAWLTAAEAGSQTAEIAGQGQIVGNGRMASEERPITAAAVINIDGAFEVAISVGQAPKLTLSGDANILPIIRTATADGRLDIYPERSYSANRAISIRISTPHLTSLAASGSNHIEAKDIDGGELSVTLNGSNNAALAGKVAALTARLNGSNKLSAAALAADAASVRLAGSGDASVDARQKIAAEIFGSGSITVTGNPSDRHSRVNGSGSVTFVK
jgi:Putative auto-transporter adhesin, head GIN domain